MGLQKELEEIEAKAFSLRRQIASADCQQVGHNWEAIGGRSAYCADGCGCSIPVYECTKCGDCDYGENEEAVEVIAFCKMKGGV